MIGVGKLGQDCAEVMADAGYDVVGYDIEPRTPAFPMRNTIQEAVSDRDMIFIAAPTPHDPIYGGETPTSHLPNKDFDYTIVKNILAEVNKYVNKNQLVVLISTVLPGTVRNQLEPYITNARFIYNPYLIAMGTIKWDMVNPEMVIIGTEDGSMTGDAKELVDFYKVFMQNDPRYEIGTWDEAESIKIFYNTFISTKLSLVNMIQDVAETNGNINVDVVTNALKKSTYRIMGPAYMTAAFGDAGACHPRDNIALQSLADGLGLGYDLFGAIMRAREIQAERMALRCLRNGRNVTIVGKAYKPGVPYTNGSASMLVGFYIERHGGNLNYYDPNTGDTDLRENWTQVYLIGYWEPWVEQLQIKDPGAVVIDPWRKMTSRQHTGEIIHYGDSRPKHRYTVPDSTIHTMRMQLFEMLPDLKPYDDSICLIDATINMETTFVMRPTEDIVEHIRNNKKLGKSKFVFFACTEAFMPHVLSKVQRIASILDGEIDKHDFILLTTVPDAEHIYQQKLRKEFEWNKDIRILSVNFFNYITTTYARGFEYIGGYDVRHKGKLFTCFNKLNREHRMQLVNRMLSVGLVDKAYYSFEGDERFINQIDDLNDKYAYIKLHKNEFPLKLNITPDRSNPVEIQVDDLIYYKDSYFSVITETLFYNKDYPNQHHRPYVEDSLFLTEKTYRCFALLHPFILMARPHSLHELRKQGYRTFSPYIDESYDEIENDSQRFEAIFKEIKRLSSFDGNEWQIWANGIKEIVEFNQNHFHANRNFSFTQNYVDFFQDLAPVNRSASVVTQPKPVIVHEEVKPVIIEPVLQEQPMPVVSSVIEKPLEQPIEQTILEKPVDRPVPTGEYFQSHLVEGAPDYPSKLRPTVPQSNLLDWRNRKLVFENGLIVNFPNHVDGGGYDLKDEIFSLLDRTGKDRYNRALDWCSGYGPFGFDLLDKNKVDHVAFTDCYDVAIETCINNANANNIGDRVTGYTTDRISNVPANEKFDLVVANPPHSSTSAHIGDTTVNTTLRMIVDEDYEAHQEFYANIRNYLTPDADVYITSGSNMDYFVKWAALGGLVLMGFSPSMIIPNGGIYHFKPQP